MKKLVLLLAFALCSASAIFAQSIYDYTMVDIDGNEVPLSNYKGKVVVIVNTASECGLTPQYKDLQDFYLRYKDRGLVILGFPANNFGGQEPGSDPEIKEFCSAKYAVTFPMFSKISVKEPGKHPLYHYLTEKSYNNTIDAEVTWNFQKFIIDKNGKVVLAVSPRVGIFDDLPRRKIEELLKQ